MDVIKQQHSKAPPSIKVVLDDPTMERIALGPLKATGGRGAASWVRQLILRDLDEFDAIRAGKTQISLPALEGKGATP